MSEPEVVGEHDGRSAWSAGFGIVGGCEGTARERRDAQYGEVIARNENALDRCWFFAEAHIEAFATVGAQGPYLAPNVAMPGNRAKSPPEDEPEPGVTRGSKTTQVIAMLQRKNGATLAEIMTIMGWQKHTVRGFMAGTIKKAGYAVESFRSDNGERTYRIKRSVEPIPQPTRRRRGRLSGLKGGAVWISLESVPVLPAARNN